MSKEIQVMKYDGDGHEIIGMIAVKKIMHDEGSEREFHLELDIPDVIAGELVKYGSEVMGHLDLMTVGIRGAFVEALAREKNM
tara:strand:- start:300 stop:548 length:249 start_codon:yes stop_codon:yes gene_type:complete